MKLQRFTQGALTGLLLAGLTMPVLAGVQARDQDQQRMQEQISDQDIYGWQLMNGEERDAYRAKLRAAKTEQERERIRAEHHEQMKMRAKQRGVTLPDEPPAGRGPVGDPGPGGGGPGGGRR